MDVHSNLGIGFDRKNSGSNLAAVLGCDNLDFKKLTKFVPRSKKRPDCAGGEVARLFTNIFPEASYFERQSGSLTGFYL